MRAPPEVETRISGLRSESARSAARAIFSPTTEPMEPAMKKNSMAPMITGIPSIDPEPITIASEVPTCSSAARRRSRYFLLSRNRRGSDDRRFESSSTYFSSSKSIRRRSGAESRKWNPHLGQILKLRASSLL